LHAGLVKLGQMMICNVLELLIGSVHLALAAKKFLGLTCRCQLMPLCLRQQRHMLKASAGID